MSTQEAVKRTTLEGPADTSGSKNAIQAIASAVTYLRSRVTGRQLNVKELEESANIAIRQAAEACNGHIRGRIAEASYNNAIEVSNRLWEWYAAINSDLSRAISELREASHD